MKRNQWKPCWMPLELFAFGPTMNRLPRVKKNMMIYFCNRDICEAQWGPAIMIPEARQGTEVRNSWITKGVVNAFSAMAIELLALPSLSPWSVLQISFFSKNRKYIYILSNSNSNSMTRAAVVELHFDMSLRVHSLVLAFFRQSKIAWNIKTSSSSRTVVQALDISIAKNACCYGIQPCGKCPCKETKSCSNSW